MIFQTTAKVDQCEVQLLYSAKLWQSKTAVENLYI